MCYKHIGYNLNVMQQSVCLVLTQEWLLCMYMYFAIKFSELPKQHQKYRLYKSESIRHRGGL